MVWGAIAGAFLGGISSAVSTSSENAQAQASADKQNKYNRDIYDFQVAEANRQYEYAVEGLEISKRNTEKNLKFQEAERALQYDYGMGIRQYEHNQAIRVYDASVSRALAQQSFSELATQAALVDQDRALHEQLLSLSFEETETLLNYGAAAAGLGLKKRQARGAALTEVQATRISALKAAGQAQARGTAGRSSAKVVQGLIAESGARQAAIIDALMYTAEGVDADFVRLGKQFAIDQVAFETTRESAMLSDMAARNKIAQQALQTAINAEASIVLKPEIAPPLPKPLALPRPEYQDIFKPGTPPPPMVQAAMQKNMFSSIVGGAMSGAQTGASIQSSFGSMNKFQGGSQGGIPGITPGLSSANYSDINYSGGALTGAFSSGSTGLGASSFGGFGFAPSTNSFSIGQDLTISPFLSK